MSMVSMKGAGNTKASQKAAAILNSQQNRNSTMQVKKGSVDLGSDGMQRRSDGLIHFPAK